MLINGQEYSYAQAEFGIGTGIVNGITAMSYEDTTEIKDNWGAGNRPVSRSRGKYEAKGSMTLHMSEVEAITAQAPNGDLAQIPMFDVTVVFIPELGQSPVTHKLRGCQFLGNKRNLTQSADGITVDLDLIVAEIQWK